MKQSDATVAFGVCLKHWVYCALQGLGRGARGGLSRGGPHAGGAQAPQRLPLHGGVHGAPQPGDRDGAPHAGFFVGGSEGRPSSGGERDTRRDEKHGVVEAVWEMLL